MRVGPAGGAADTIFAISSGSGRAGVAVLRVSGPLAGAALVRLAGCVPEARRAVLTELRDPRRDETLDRALVLWFPGPRSFSGEDVAEFHLHGGRAVIQGVVDALGAMDGLRPAEAGEFTRRAFENGKMDLTAVEGLADLINAETEAQRRQALRQTAGGLRNLYDAWRGALMRALALVEAALDFSDEADVPGEIASGARPLAFETMLEIRAHLDDRNRGERLRDGLWIVLAGPPNVGKSSLLNALARRDAAIVSEEVGTTRDVIEVHFDLGGYPVVVMDTAGLREAAGLVEEEGVRRTYDRAGEADVVLWIIDAAAPVWDVPERLRSSAARVIGVLNKIDLRDPADKPHECDELIEISAKTGCGLVDLMARLQEAAAGEMAVGEVPQITRARHRRELETCEAALERFLEGSLDLLELRAEDLRQAAVALGRITGRVDVEDVLDRIFGEFCIGK